jgi:hypothetical protein
MIGDAVIESTLSLLDSLNSRDLGVLGFRVTAGPVLVMSTFATGDLSPIFGDMIHNFLRLSGVLTSLGLLFEFTSVLVMACMMVLCYWQFDSSSPMNIVKIGDASNASTFCGPLVFFSLFLYIGRRGAGKLSADYAITSFMASRRKKAVANGMPWEDGAKDWDANRVKSCTKEEARQLVVKLKELQKANEKLAAARSKLTAEKGDEDAVPADCASRLGDKKSK